MENLYMYSSLKYENIIRRLKRQLQVVNRIAKREDKMTQIISAGLEKECLEQDKNKLITDLLEACKASYNTAEELKDIIDLLGKANHKVTEEEILEGVYMVDVKVLENAVKVTLPQLRHRESIYIHRIPYEKLLISKLKETIKTCNLDTISESVIVFEHITSGHCTRDNDNYDTYESKQIIDAIVTSGLIKSDIGEYCSIMHITKALCDEPYTNVYIVAKDSFSYFFNDL